MYIGSNIKVENTDVVIRLDFDKYKIETDSTGSFSKLNNERHYSEVVLASVDDTFADNALKCIKQHKAIAEELKYSVLIENLKEKFKNDIIRLGHYIGEHSKEATDFFTQSLNHLLEIKADKIIFSLTASKSISYRIYEGEFQINIELFYLKENAEENIEAVFSIYKNNEKIKNGFGSLNSSFNEIKDEILINQIESINSDVDDMMIVI